MAEEEGFPFTPKCFFINAELASSSKVHSKIHPSANRFVRCDFVGSPSQEKADHRRLSFPMLEFIPKKEFHPEDILCLGRYRQRPSIIGTSMKTCERSSGFISRGWSKGMRLEGSKPEHQESRCRNIDRKMRVSCLLENPIWDRRNYRK
jgi:hypothetical protein